MFSFVYRYNRQLSRGNSHRDYLNKDRAFLSMSSSTTTASSKDNDGEDAVSYALIRQRKQELRKLIRARMKSTYPTSKETNSSVVLLNSTSLLGIQSDLVFHRLFQLRQYASANSVGIFLSMPLGEIQTTSAITRMIKDNKSLYVPRVGLNFDIADMDMIRCDEYIKILSSSSLLSKQQHDDDNNSSNNNKIMFYDDWPRNKWGIPEPPVKNDDSALPVAKPGDIDILIVPGCAFDKVGRRLGHGKGYYDRFIAKNRIEYDNDTIGSNDTVPSITTSGDENEKNGPATTTTTTTTTPTTTTTTTTTTPTPTIPAKKKKPQLVGVCLEEQYLQKLLPRGILSWEEDAGQQNDDGGIIPITNHDCIMDVILTPSKTILLRNFH